MRSLFLLCCLALAGCGSREWRADDNKPLAPIKTLGEQDPRMVFALERIAAALEALARKEGK